MQAFLVDQDRSAGCKNYLIKKGKRNFLIFNPEIMICIEKHMTW